MCCLRRCSRVEKNPTKSVLVESPCGACAGLQSHDVQVVPQAHIGPDGCRQGGHAGTDGPDGVSLGGGNTASADTEGSSSSCCCGRDLGGVTDGAVTPGSSDADIVVLAGQMGLRGSHRTGTRVPIKAGNRSCSTIIS